VIGVLNASGVNGMAASKASELTNAGFTNATGGNFVGGTPPSANTVYYKIDAERPTAEKVASVLGIPSIVKSDSLDGGIQVVIVQ
jgi:hypothetical protein